MTLVSTRGLAPIGGRQRGGPLPGLGPDGAVGRGGSQPILGTGVPLWGFKRLQLEGQRDSLVGLIGG